MTSMVPEMLDRLLIGMDKLMATALNVESRQTALECEMRVMSRAIYLGKLRTNNLRERNRTPQGEMPAALPQLFRDVLDRGVFIVRGIEEAARGHQRPASTSSRPQSDRGSPMAIGSPSSRPPSTGNST